MIDILVVILLVAAALYIVVRALWRMTKHAESEGCPGCPGCRAPDEQPSCAPDPRLQDADKNEER